MLTISAHSHLDHGLLAEHLRFILTSGLSWNEFHLETLEVPQNLYRLTCGLYGPLMGDPPVQDSEVDLAPRGDRQYPSRLLKPDNRFMRPTRLLTVIAGPHEGLPCMLYTAFGGPLTPREPGDPTIPDADRAASAAFWAEHALARDNLERAQHKAV
jgi:hypothetical protein